MMSATGITRTNRHLFTPTQWQELEHQALIYKYMVSGVPIPPELIYSIRRSLDSSLTSRLIPHQSIGWGCFQVGFGRKPDPEPGRCRRTDGKKWRCSKEAYPDSKYCEKHMHRGRNRSRKPVESPNSTPTTASTSLSSTNRSISSTNSFSLSSSSSSSSSPASLATAHDSHNANATHQSNPKFSTTAYLSHSLYPFYSTSSSSKPADYSLCLQNSSAQLNVLDAGSCSQADKDLRYRYFHGIRENVDERAFFPEASGSSNARSLHDTTCQPLAASFCGDSSLRQQQQEQRCFLMGTDMFNSKRRIKPEQNGEDDEDDDDESKKPLHHFFTDDWPPTKNSTDSWLDLSSNSKLDTGS